LAQFFETWCVQKCTTTANSPKDNGSEDRRTSEVEVDIEV